MALLSLGLVVCALVSTSHSAVYWNRGVRSSMVSLCFVGDALTAQPARVQQILDYIAHYTWVANVRFNFLGTCPAPTTQANGDDYHDGDIRVVIPDTSVDATTVQVPGKGCPQVNTIDWKSFSNAPDDLTSHRSCLYNLKLGDDPWNGVPYLNHTLHEFGHALGLAHEHERIDVDYTLCKASGFGGAISSGFLTPYDRYSVMNYGFCGIPGNYDYTGLSSWDALAAHILYPETNRVAEFVGTTVIRWPQRFSLESAWRVRGANMPMAVQSIRWTVNGVTVSTQSDLDVHLKPEEYVLGFTYRDFLGRDHAYSGPARVLDADVFARTISGPIAARLVLSDPRP